MIPLYVHDGVAHVWNAKDWDTLRSNYRICGALIGSVASYPRQNDFLGLPLALMSEEATLLVEKGLCELVDLPNINEKPSSELKNKIEEIEKRVLIEQMEAFRKRKVEQISQKIDIIVAGKKQKLLSKGITDVNLDKQVLLQEEINKLPDLSPAHALVHLPTEIIKETEKRNVTVAVLKPSVLDHVGGIRYSIFKDLWEQGHYITQGSKFGSDFLVYPGDPVRFHAAYMVRCICNQATQFSPSSLVAFGRLSVAVNKMAVLASCNVFGNIEYQTLQWHDGAIGCSGDF